MDSQKPKLEVAKGLTLNFCYLQGQILQNNGPNNLNLYVHIIFLFFKIQGYRINMRLHKNPLFIVNPPPPNQLYPWRHWCSSSINNNEWRFVLEVSEWWRRWRSADNIVPKTIVTPPTVRHGLVISSLTLLGLCALRCCWKKASKNLVDIKKICFVKKYDAFIE